MSRQQQEKRTDKEAFIDLMNVLRAMPSFRRHKTYLIQNWDRMNDAKRLKYLEKNFNAEKASVINWTAAGLITFFVTVKVAQGFGYANADENNVLPAFVGVLMGAYIWRLITRDTMVQRSAPRALAHLHKVMQQQP